MNTTHTAFEDGKRADVTGTFVTRRTMEAGGERIHRLLLEDESGAQHTLLLRLEATGVVDFLTGATYRFEDVLGSGPPESAPDDAPACPDCGGDLRPGRAADAVGEAVTAAARKLGLREPFGIVDEHTAFHRVEQSDVEDVVDDWQPMETDAASDVTPPEYVCDACGRTLDAYERRRAHGSADTDMGSPPGATLESVAEPAAAPPSEETLGLAAGGAKDAGNFRENVAQGYTPQPEAISDEGLFYDYHFETGGGRSADADALFAPRYATAVSDHPLTGEREHYLSVGLDSTLSMADFERPRLDLVAVLDVSGSMESPFDEYYYDEHGRKQAADAEIEGEGDRRSTTKMEAAAASLCALTEQLHDEDRLGVVLFNNRAHVAKPLRDVGRTDMPAIRRHIREVQAGGGTNMEDGFEAALDMLLDGDASARTERRVVFMTDMMPNVGATGEGRLTQLFGDAAAEGVHTTFVGMGLDSNAELADALSGIRGANHYFVHSAAEFERRLGAEFDYMVTPLVYDLSLELDAGRWEIATVHGAPSDDATRGRLMDVGTLFPSSKEDGAARGGVVLVRLERDGSKPGVDADDAPELVASWTERDGSSHRERAPVDVPTDAPTYEHSGIRKAVALARYARTLREWARDVHQRSDRATGVDDWLLPDRRGEHERESVPLVVPERHADRFDVLRDYLASEMDHLGDADLTQELDLLATLCEEAPARPTEVRE